jgi:hypothetical protein
MTGACCLNASHHLLQLLTLLHRCCSCSDLFQFDLIPWGNAKLGDKGGWSCQHGPRECQYNALLSCAKVSSSQAHPQS